MPMNRSRRCLQVGVLVAALAAAGASAAASERWETLEAIHCVENPRNSTRVGPRGELGPYQFRPATWGMYTREPFALAADREHADEVAVQHYEGIRRGLLSAGITPTPYRSALAWNAGLDTVIHNRVPAAACAYAEQVANLVFSMRAQRIAGAP